TGACRQYSTTNASGVAHRTAGSNGEGSGSRYGAVAYSLSARVLSRRRTAAATASIRAAPETAASARARNLPEVRAIAARGAAVGVWKSTVAISHSLGAENLSMSRWMFHTRASITSANTRACKALIAAAASERLV